MCNTLTKKKICRLHAVTKIILDCKWTLFISFSYFKRQSNACIHYLLNWGTNDLWKDLKCRTLNKLQISECEQTAVSSRSFWWFNQIFMQISLYHILNQWSRKSSKNCRHCNQGFRRNPCKDVEGEKTDSSMCWDNSAPNQEVIH